MTDQQVIIVLSIVIAILLAIVFLLYFLLKRNIYRFSIVTCFYLLGVLVAAMKVNLKGSAKFQQISISLNPTQDWIYIFPFIFLSGLLAYSLHLYKKNNNE